MPRRNVIRLGGALAVAGTGIAGVSALSAMTDNDVAESQWVDPVGPDPEQRFVALTAAADGVIYGVQSDGTLAWMRHEAWRDGRPVWANDGNARVIGTGWLKYRWILPGADGQILALTANGDVAWHRYILTNPKTGDGTWDQRSGSVIGQKLGDYWHWFGGWDGVLYGVNGHGLYRFRYTAGDGTAGPDGWAQAGRPLRISNPLSGTPFAAADGQIFEIDGARLLLRRYTGSDSAPAWAGGGKPIELGDAWADQRWVCAGESGVLYSIDNARGNLIARAGKLRWRRYSGPAGQEVSWPYGEARDISDGFTIERLARLQGYAMGLATTSGKKLGLAVSTGHSHYSVTVSRLASGTQPLATVAETQRVRGRLQHLPGSYQQDGCGWTAQYEVKVADDWRSGLYAARLQTDDGTHFDIPFAVRPAGDPNPVAFLWPTNTYNAYNEWGGHSQYTEGLEGQQRTLTFKRPSIFSNVDGPADRRITGDLMLLKWMSSERIPFDCYHDHDLHEAGEWLDPYKALILAMHPEYWSEQMRRNLKRYMENGGRVIYVGGNGIYERVTFGNAGGALTFRRPDGERDLFRNSGQPEHELLGVGYHEPSFGTRAAYKVLREHPLLKGTGLKPGDLFGETGSLGAASGWEADRRGLVGGASAEEVIAEGLNPRGGAEMIFRRGPKDGWVFSAGSITFTGALQTDRAVRRLLRNVIDLALG